MFSGTPCQCAGLKNFLGKDYKNLLTVDIICQGVPSPLFWEKYISEYGHAHEITNSVALRPSCHNCKFKFPSVQSDLTLGNAWGVQNFAPEMFDNQGTSLVIIHTSKGKKFFEQTNLNRQEVNFSDIVVNNPRFIISSVAAEHRGEFFSDLARCDFLTVMQKYCYADNLRQDEDFQRNLVKTYQGIAAHYRQKFKRNILILTLTWGGGGAKVFIDHYTKKHFQNCGVYILQHVGNGQLVCTEKFSALKLTLKEDIGELSNLIKHFNITEIFVNHLIDFNIAFTGNWLLKCGVPYKFFIHDFLCVCANYHLYCRAGFCAMSDTNNYCRQKFLEIRCPSVRFKDWQNFFFKLLSRAEKIIAPSTFAANIVKNFYPPLSIEIEPHYLTQPMKKTFRPEFARREKLRVTFLGIMFFDKGEEYLLELNKFIREENLALEFVVLGEYVGRLNTGTKDGIIFAGKYDYKKVSDKLAEFETALVALLSVVPETYCYTASEAILSGYPVLTTNIGAQAARVDKNACGWVINIMTQDKGLSDLKNFLRAICTSEGREEISRRAEQTANFVNGME